ncbi:MAG: hypothetical protein BAJALOKI2v1_110060 [Promethearchaeota archaeon]|nr:MAG: hypothetical protein BAJALOKI2v1_110060 [Candidatus Lokiarchaeota archaeon]
MLSFKKTQGKFLISDTSINIPEKLMHNFTCAIRQNPWVPFFQ